MTTDEMRALIEESKHTYIGCGDEMAQDHMSLIDRLATALESTLARAERAEALLRDYCDWFVSHTRPVRDGVDLRHQMRALLADLDNPETQLTISDSEVDNIDLNTIYNLINGSLSKEKP